MNKFKFKKAFTLAEGGKLRAGFTLAEVLIVMGVIGVVAALTIPTLIANIKSARYRTQFKKSISTLAQVGKLNLARYDWTFSDIDSDPGDGDVSNAGHDHPDKIKSLSAMLNANLAGATFYEHGGVYAYKEGDEDDKNMAYEDAQYPREHNGEDFQHFFAYKTNVLVQRIYSLPDGSMFLISNMAGTGDGNGCSLSPGESLTEMLKSTDRLYKNECIGYIDVNGTDGPNVETGCADEETKLDPEHPCVVDNSSISDIFPVVFYNDTVSPASNAAAYVLNTTK